MPIETPRYTTDEGESGLVYTITYYDYIAERLAEMAGKIGKGYTEMADSNWLNFDAVEGFHALSKAVALFSTAYNHLENGEVTKAEKALNRITFTHSSLPDSLNEYRGPEEIAERVGGTLDKETWKISPGWWR